MTYSTVLTIAGSDSGGGAGIQADIKSISATGSYAASAITAVTVQNTLGVQAIHPVPDEIVVAQIRCVLDDIGADAVKIGMIHSAQLINAVAQVLSNYLSTISHGIVLDPVMLSTSGHRLMAEDAVNGLKSQLIPLARVITPNVPEAEALTGEMISSSKDLALMACKLSAMFPNHPSVLMKAGHCEGLYSSDVFYNAETDNILLLQAKRTETNNTHGTGCTLSSAIASYLAQGFTLDDSIQFAKKYITQAIMQGEKYEIGHGHGPVNHFFAFQPFLG